MAKGAKEDEMVEREGEREKKRKKEEGLCGTRSCVTSVTSLPAAHRSSSSNFFAKEIYIFLGHALLPFHFLTIISFKREKRRYVYLICLLLPFINPLLTILDVSLKNEN